MTYLIVSQCPSFSLTVSTVRWIRAFTAASSKSDQVAIANILAEHGREGFAAAWLRHKSLDWAADLLAPQRDRPQELVRASLEVTP